ncbi:MAG: ABC transporter ATP-binding protein [Deltaproteobacteria bacterium]|jgi:branched-chain amino acid transport system ATP-binding protein|nr:ABC transporter ATP-binding protein [Deltaproteobacteria bacterium]MBW2511458.1 ABC transporter ATP-binding protein [Deltaproteobacteria bacterium]MDH4008980.1 ABC transporter ATP-binding protein [Desulfuromonadales bacterium]
MSDVVLKITDLNAHYGHIHALRGISLEVKSGQIVTLLGANGAGKSTTMKCISGLLKPTGGKIEFMGENIFGKPAHDIVKRGLIHVPEGRRIFKGMTIQENLELGSFTLKDDAERKKRMDHVYELFPVLGERRHRDAGLLSGGEQQMLAMGRALMIGQKLVLLDEPSMGLAPFLVKDIMKVVKRLNEEGITILLVEQNAKMALGVADYGYVVETGEIVMHDEAEVLKNDERIINAYLGE